MGLTAPLNNTRKDHNNKKNMGKRSAGSRFAVFVLLGMVVSVVFMCGLYVGSAFMEMHTTDLDSQSALFIFKESPNRLRGAVRSLEDFFEGHRATPPPANPHGQNGQAMGASAHSMAVPAGVAVPRPPAVQEVKQEVKPEIKPEIEPEIEPEVKPVAQPKAKPAEPKVERQAEAPVAAAAAAAAVIAPEAAKPKKQEAEDGPYPVPLGHEDKAVYLDSSASKGAKLSFPYDFPSMTLSAWIYMPQARATNTMNTILGNKASGCETNAERMGYSLYVNSWETSDRQLIFEWGNEQSGCNKLVSGRGEGHLIEFDKWTHVAAAIDADSATIYINGVQVASQQSIERKSQESSAFTVGRNSDDTYPFLGRISSLVIFKEALPASRVQDLVSTPLHDSLFKGETVALAVPFADVPKKAAKDANRKVHDVASQVVGSYVLPLDTSMSTVKLLEGIPESALTEVTDEMRAESDVTARERAPQIVNAMKRVWGAYKTHAWGHDELKPISLHGQDNWGGIGCTLVDSLDTLWLMGLKDEFYEARDWVRDKLTFARTGSVSVFETTIRELGGLLSAYDLSGDRVFLEKAKDLGERLLPAFNTPTGIPTNQANLQTKSNSAAGWTGGSSVLAELGTLQVEFRYLSRHTGDPIFAEKVNKVFDLLADKHPADGLFPIYLNPQNGDFQSQQITFGALGDSFYEYLLKVWLQGGKTEGPYRRMFDDAMDGVINKLLKKSTPSGLLYVTDLEGGHNVHKMDHLACFLPAVLALGAKTLPTEDQERYDKYMAAAQGLTHTCYQMYHRYPTHLAPEYVRFVNGQDMVAGASFYILRPETAEALFYMHQLTGHPIYREWSWEIFQGIDRYCRTKEAYGAHPDVGNTQRTPDDRMESFFLAETMKYLYLIQDPDQPIDLLKYVFNTEAHPMRVWGADDERPITPMERPAPKAPKADVEQGEEQMGEAGERAVAGARRRQRHRQHA